jgi:hypothetical protein
MVVLLLLLLLMVLVALAVLALPLLHARSEAKAAEADLAQAQAALSAHHIGVARSSIKSAGSEIQAAQHDANGFGSDVWSHVPVFGSAVTDARHLVDALDEATQVGALGTDAYARAIGPHSNLVTGNTVDVPALRTLAATVTSVGPHLSAAQADLSSIQADAPFLGPKIAALRDEASSQLASAQRSYQTTGPVLQRLPAMLGAHGPRQYLIAMMNPFEQRFSGGATLTMSALSVSQGRISFGKSYTEAEISSRQPLLRWPRVSGNALLSPRPRHLIAATSSPWWQVSGDELSRAWEARTGQRVNGVFAIDLQSLAALIGLTGPVQVPGYGELTAHDLVTRMAGAYDRFQDPVQRHALNLAIIPVFRERLLAGGRFVQKAQLLQSQASGRHVALYFRDRGEERAFAALGFDGNLAATKHDYIGVFTHNRNGSKMDYWQHRAIASQVVLHADGSARVHLKVGVSNGAPPYTLTVPDPKHGYTTHYLGSRIGVFLPRFAKLGEVSTDGAPYTPNVRQPRVPGLVNREFFTYSALLAPSRTATVAADYTVPFAADVTSDNTMTYSLDVDPQDLVTPETLRVSVAFPQGWSAVSLPTGWRATAKGATWHGPVPTKLHVEIPLESARP